MKSDLFSNLGEPGSGGARYSAAMYFYNLGLVSTEQLEIYRRCSKFDSESPMTLSDLEGVARIAADGLVMPYRETS